MLLSGVIREALEPVKQLLTRLHEKADKIMSALTDLQAADASLRAEVATFLADIASALSAEDPDIETVVADINSQVAALQAADPAATTQSPNVSS
jgi:hypothetical protein